MNELAQLRRKKMHVQGGCCYYCGLPMWDEGCDEQAVLQTVPKGVKKLLRCTAEHLHARSEGGKETPMNIVAACMFCNRTRHRAKCAKSPDDYRDHVIRRMAAGKWLAGMSMHLSQRKAEAFTATRKPPRPCK